MNRVMVSSVTSKGQELLAKHIKSQGDLRKIAQRLNIDEGVVGAYYRGTRKPVTKNRERLRIELHIPLLSWDEPPVGAHKPRPSEAP